jgi:iron complex transport system permease protein
MRVGVRQPSACGEVLAQDAAWTWSGIGLCCAALGLLLASALASLLIGEISVSVHQVVDALVKHGGSQAEMVVWTLRVPRVVVGVLAGACFAVSGALMQGMTRNPLADPTLTGVAAGAACAIVAAQVLWPTLAVSMHPLLGIAGGLVAATLTFALAWRERLSPIQLALAGLAVSAFATAGITTLLIVSGPDAASLFFWLSGGLAGRSWTQVALLLPWALAGMALAWICAKPLNIMALGDDATHTLGLNMGLWRMACGLAAVMLAAGAVAVAGPLGFVGLCVPHIARLCVGNDHQRLLWVSALLGAALVCAADLLARTVAAPRELPAGFLTALIAAPLLIKLVHKREAA